MSRLRHPIRAIREPFGKAGLTVAILALVFATAGGAYAANKLTSKEKKEVEKIAKKFAGKPGAPGAAGTAGTNGTNGTNGKDGAPGTAGDDGTDGVSVTGTAIPTSSATCNHQGGTAYTSKTGTENVCNGSPWTAGGTLPSGSTETGSWGIGRINERAVYPGNGESVTAPISFSVPLAEEMENCVVNESTFEIEGLCTIHWMQKDGDEFNPFFEEIADPEFCEGSAAEPTAAPGHLCIYTGYEVGEIAIIPTQGLGFINPGTGEPNSVSTAGLLLKVIPKADNTQAGGTWAVTAE